MKREYNHKYLAVSVIIVLYASIIRVEEFNIFTEIIGSVLMISTILLAFFGGYFGIAFSVVLNLVGAYNSYIHYIRLKELLYVPIIFNQLSIVILSIFIGLMAESLRKRKEQVKDIIYKDPLTGLFNLNYLYRIKDDLLLKGNKSISCIVIDLSNFSEINRKFGFITGDIVLIDISKILKKLMNSSDFLFRGSSDRFVIFLLNTSVEDAEETLMLVYKKINHYKYINKAQKINIERLDINSGMSSYPENVLSQKEVMNQAIENLNESKKIKYKDSSVYQNVINNINKGMNNNLDIGSMTHILLGLVDSKDYYTYSHSQRVVKYIDNFGVALDLSFKEIEKLKLAALLHDVGKIDLPATILNKRGKLTFEEFNIIKKHSTLGSDIVLKIDGLEGYAPIIRGHHERYDGMGYPDKLIGKEIPLYSRILALCDSLDAMLSNRPYRKGMSLEEAIAEIRANSGTQFDPNLTDLFIESIINNTNEVQIMQSFDKKDPLLSIE